MRVLRSEDCRGLVKRDAYIYIFILGFLGIFSQTFLFRELSFTLRANELILALLLFYWLLWGGLGSSIGLPRPGFGGKFFIYLLLVPLNILLAKFWAGLLQNSPGEFFSLTKVLAVMSLLLIPFCYLSGSLFLEISRAFTRAGGKAYKLYAVDAIGAMLGGVFTSLLIARASALLLLSIATLAPAIFLFLWKRKLRGWCTALICIIIPVSLFSRTLERKFDALLWRGFKIDKIIESIYTKSLILSRQGERFLYEAGSLVAATGDSVTQELLVHPIFSQVERVDSAFVVGGTVLNILAEIRKYEPDELVIVEADPRIGDVFRAFRSQDMSERVLIGDPRYILRNTEKKYDLIVLFLPNPTSGFMNRFYTREFFELARERLNVGGIFALHLSVGENYPSTLEQLLATSIWRGIKETFRNETIFYPGGRLLYMASDSIRFISPVVAIPQRNIPLRYLRGQNLYYDFEPFRQERIRKLLDQRTEEFFTNTDLHPIAYLLGLFRWLKLKGLQYTLAKRLAWLFYGLVALLILIAKLLNLTVFRKKPVIEQLLFISIWGLVGMAIQLTAVYFFQASCGYLYWALGVMTGGMMLGLVLGSIASSRIKEYHLGIRGIGVVGVLWALLLLFLSYRLDALSGLSGSVLVLIFFVFLVVQGALVGALFPQNVNFMLAREIFGERRMGVAYALDLIGASVGALVVGTLLLPVLGIQISLVILIFLLALSMPFRL